MDKHTKIIIASFALLSILLFYFAGATLYSNNQIVKLNQSLEKGKSVKNFLNLFVEKVIGGNKELTFEERLQLENSVRAINDKDIFDKWQELSLAKSEQDAQVKIKDLLSLLTKKISSN